MKGNTLLRVSSSCSYYKTHFPEMGKTIRKQDFRAYLRELDRCPFEEIDRYIIDGWLDGCIDRYFIEILGSQPYLADL